MNLAVGLPALALSLLLTAFPATTTSAIGTDQAQVVLDPARELVATALKGVVPGDIHAVRLTSWQVMPIAPTMQTVIGRASLDAGGAEPIGVAFRANVDTASGEVMHLSYRMLEPSNRASKAPLQVTEALRNRISGEMVAQFPNQAVEFHINKITGSTRTAHEWVIQGEGLSNFFAEGQARTPFVATFALPSAQLLKLDYDLVAVPEALTPTAANR